MSEMVQRSPVQVLVVSADPALCSAFVLGLAGVAHVSTTTLDDAPLHLEGLLQTWPERLPILVILDLVADERAFALLRTYRDDQRLRTAPLVALLSDSRDDSQRSLALEQANGVLSRPDDAQTLELVVGAIRALWLEAAQLPYQR